MLNIVIPMAGHGSRFSRAGFTEPKPFIKLAGVPMIELVIRNLRPSRKHRFIFVCQQEHLTQFDFRQRLEALAPGCKIVGLSQVTEGTACTVLQAAPWIDNDDPLMIANADQWVNICIDDYLDYMDRCATDGMIMTMNAQDPKWSYVLLDQHNRVCTVVEKEVVSEMATVGIYNFCHGKVFCRLARNMIAENRRSQGEFYVAPVYSDLYREGRTDIGFYCIGKEGAGMHGLGTPDDMEAFLAHPILELALADCSVEQLP
ncbi:hypothetical protein BJP35_0009 [Enterobacter sp. J49]|uniref:glycosyltransferase family 2 protein n=1 Tax=Enterobacter sp. J49 TaxID=1903627 RepID=UPI000A3C87FE|nr:glycosyltransferase family 2 protein [Enterobacter sp. J49]OUC39421.1 hypothetical protein BJP35_0009 [Enterobacter sp. J49]